MKEGQCPNVGRTRKGGHNDVGKTISSYSTRDKATQTTNNTYKGAAQEGKGP
jgi:hypothetical protein